MSAHNQPDTLPNTNSSSTLSLDSTDAPTGSAEGYENEFVDPLDNKYECPICLMCLRDPYQTECGHRFCRLCIKRWLRDASRGKKCPVCNVSLTPQLVHPDNFAKREILSLVAKCLFAKNGCDKSDSLKLMEDHEEFCLHRIVTCIKCTASMRQMDMDRHRLEECPKRTVSCSLCSDRLLFTDIEQHKIYCSTASNCCQQCGKKLEQNEDGVVISHECSENVVKCRFRRFGCNFQCPSNEMVSHMTECQNEHLLSMLGALERVMDSDTPSDDNRLLKTEVAAMLPTSAGAVAGAMALQPPTRDDEYDDLKKPHPDKRGLGDMRMAFHSGEYVVADEAGLLSDLRHKVATQQQHILELRSKVTYLSDELTHTRKELDFTRSEFNRCCNGSFIWRLHNYQSLRDASKKSTATCVLHSPGFYTSYNGYKFCIRLNLNGVENAQGTHLSLFIHVMQSENDDVLSWPFLGKITLSIIDQNKIPAKRNHITEILTAKPGLEAFQKPNTMRNHKGFGYMEFAPLSFIESTEREFIKGDTLIIRADVKYGK